MREFNLELTNDDCFKTTKTLCIDRSTVNFKIERFCGDVKKVYFRCIDKTRNGSHVNIIIDVLDRTVDCKYEETNEKDSIPFVEFFTINHIELSQFYTSLVEYLFY